MDSIKVISLFLRISCGSTVREKIQRPDSLIRRIDGKTVWFLIGSMKVISVNILLFFLTLIPRIFKRAHEISE